MKKFLALTLFIISILVIASPVDAVKRKKVRNQPSTQYTCNCSKSCTRITSCAEAYFQLNTCGCSVRDGDHDGIPCENLCR